jgi:hypothetical protein
MNFGGIRESGFGIRTKIVCSLVAVLSLGVDLSMARGPTPAGPRTKQASAQQAPDPRIGLRGGLRDAGQASGNMELIASLPKPDGFFDPKVPAGLPVPPERDPKQVEKENAEREALIARGETVSPPRSTGATRFANSDLAFREIHAFAGSFHGFNTYDIEDARKPRLIVSVVCPGGQGDLSVYGNLLFMSVEQTRGRLDCGTEGIQGSVSAERFRGIRIFDITDMTKPRQVAAVQTCRGSHTHTLVPDPKDKANIYVYGSGTGAVRSAEELAGCSRLGPKEDPNTALFSIDVIKVPLSAPANALIVNRPRIFADPATGAIAGLWPGGTHGPDTQKTSATNQCHDITVFPEIGLAAGACAGNGILLDISDPVNPVRLDQVVDKNFAYWHSATFNNDGTKVVFTDEWGGGMRPRCRATDLPNWGADAIFDIIDRKLHFASYYKMPAAQTEQENCVAHNGSLIPVPGRDIMVQAWYQGGISVFDFTDSARPVEIAFFDRGPIDATQLIAGGYWSAYWYNGNIYATEIARGIDVLRLTPSADLSQNEIDAAKTVYLDRFNAQYQPRFTWPASSVVARAYLDQLTRTKAILPARAAAVKAALDGADTIRTGRERNAAALVNRLERAGTDLEIDAGKAVARDAVRLRSLAETIKGIVVTRRVR